MILRVLQKRLVVDAVESLCMLNIHACIHVSFKQDMSSNEHTGMDTVLKREDRFSSIPPVCSSDFAPAATRMNNVDM